MKMSKHAKGIDVGWLFYWPYNAKRRNKLFIIQQSFATSSFSDVKTAYLIKLSTVYIITYQNLLISDLKCVSFLFFTLFC